MITKNQWWLFFMGCNGSGKTTLARNLKLVLEQIFGECLLFDLGRFLTEDPVYADRIRHGELVPDDEVRNIIMGHTALTSEIPVRLIVGWPRTLDQSKDTIQLMHSHRNNRAVMIHVDTPLHICQDRMKQQKDRSDNTEQARERRIKTFKAATVPTIDHLKTQMHWIPVGGNQPPEDVLRDARVSLFPLLNPPSREKYPEQPPMHPHDIPQVPL